MRIIVNRYAGVLSQAGRARLESIFAQDTPNTVEKLKAMFPGHPVTARNGHFQVANKDGSVIVDIFRDGNSRLRWIESRVNLSITNK